MERLNTDMFEICPKDVVGYWQIGWLVENNKSSNLLLV